MAAAAAHGPVARGMRILVRPAGLLRRSSGKGMTMSIPTDAKTFGATSFGAFAVDYAAYLAQHDVVYETPAANPWEGIPLGDGEAGALLWMPPGGPRWELGRCDLWDDGPERPFGSWNKEDEEVATALRAAGNLTISTGLPALDWLYLKEFVARLEVFPARATLRATTPFSEVELAAFASREAGVLVIDYRDALAEPVPRRISLERWGSRVFAHWYATIVRDPSRGLDGTDAGTDDGRIWITQRTRSNRFAVALAIDGANAVAARDHSRSASITIPPAGATTFRLYLAIVSDEQAADPLAAALERVDAARREGSEALLDRHRARWADFWSRSFVKLPDGYLENLWYLNHYLMGSSSLGDYPPHFINGIWNGFHDVRSWNHYYHWNQEEAAWPVAAAGHPELARGYLRMRAAALPRAMASARRMGQAGAWYNDVFERRGWQAEGPPIYTPGLQIALDAWRIWRHTGDETFLRDVAWPLMRETCRFYLGMLVPGDDGRYHLPESHPYEHASGYMVRDCLTDLAHVRAAFPKVAAVAERMGDAAFAGRLRDVAAKLPDAELIPIPASYLKDGPEGPVFVGGWSEGTKPPFDRMVCVGRRVPDGRPIYFRADRDGVGPDAIFPGADESLVYPSGMVGLKDRGSDLFRAAQCSAVANWGEIMGWSVSPIVFARLGMADHVAEALRRHIVHFQHFPQGLWNYQGSQDGSATDLASTLDVNDRFQESDRFLFPRWPNTHFGLEAGAVVQTAINEAFLQSYEGTIRLCPAVPKDWDGAFVLWAEGGFRVAVRTCAGRAVAAEIMSARGEPCRFIPETDGDPARWIVRDAATGEVVPARVERGAVGFDAALVFDTVAGRSYHVAPADALQDAAAVVFIAERVEHPKQRDKRWIGIPRRW